MDLILGALYKLTSPINKSYIGITKKTVKNRWKQHLKDTTRRINKPLYNAIDKYGPENFKVETLVIANDWNYLCLLEQRAIKQYNTKIPNGYNLTDGGDGGTGYQFTEKDIEKLKQSRGKVEHTEESKELLRQSWTEERRKDFGESIRGDKNPAKALETRLKIKKIKSEMGEKHPSKRLDVRQRIRYSNILSAIKLKISARLTAKLVTTKTEAFAAALIRNCCKDYMTNDTSLITPEKQLNFFIEKLGNDIRLILFFHEDNPVGYGLIRKQNDKFWISGGLIESYRGRGFGTEMFEFLAGLEKETWLEVLVDNVSAHRVYSKLGFQEISRDNNIIIMRNVKRYGR